MATGGSELAGARLSVALDIRHPLAYLALAPAIEFGRELELAINWLPFRAEPLRPPAPTSAGDDRGTRHRRNRARMIAREIAVYAQSQGLRVEQPYRDEPAEAAGLAWLWMRAHAPELLEPFLLEMFRRYWALEFDASDLAAAEELVRVSGEDGAGFLEWATAEGRDALDRVGGELSGAGVAGVPAYLVGEQLFLGRQHLPVIRWLLEGSAGPVPI